MSKGRHARPGAAEKAAKAAKTAGYGIAAAAAAAGAFAVVAPAAGAATLPLQVSFQADGNGSASFNASGVPQLKIGTGSGSTKAEMDVNLTALGSNAVPVSEPTVTTDNYAAGSPRWVIELANGHSLWGYPAASKLNGSDMAWAVDNGNTYTGYATAYAAVNGPATTVKDAFIVEDGDQAGGTVDTLTNVQYGGETVGAGAASITPVATQVVTIGRPAKNVQLSASTTSSDKAVSIAVTGLPDGLHFDVATDTIYGTPAADAVSGNATATATDAYGKTASETVSFIVKPAYVKPTPVVLSGGHVVQGTLQPSRAEVAWTATPAAAGGYAVVINGPGFDMHPGHVWVTQAFYQGLHGGHTYTVYITPLDKDGRQIGATGHVTFVTPSFVTP